MASPYKTVAQKAAKSRKLSHGSPLVHDNNPSSRFKGSKNGWEYAKARVTAGGVATSSGDFLCTMMVERCFEVNEDPEMFVGEKAATVGGGTKSLASDAPAAPSFWAEELGDIEASHEWHIKSGIFAGVPRAAIQPRSDHSRTQWKQTEALGAKNENHLQTSV
ncbi:mitochondrial import inner membrane translocase subunit TIM16 [Emydomyces testavorans]|uniref:Mitochondrial import inner membrane translocase subunit TIM16 n=1 Tax=Emydomyces testavorans TaxID=2070801 RepID=A0AAF0DHY1_9EURO|nr:mitochondrial import inner membrane translocase subunit TIM16 [Emydomyces testavorans]